MPGKIVSGTTIGQGQRTATATAQSTTWEVRHVLKGNSTLIEPWRQPFLSYLFLNKGVKNMITANPQGKFEFPERELVPNTDTIKTYTSGTGTATLRIVPDEVNLYTVGKSIKLPLTSETGVVTAVSTYIDIARDLDTDGNAQTWSTPTAGDTIWLLGEAMGDIDSPPSGVYAVPYMRTSRVQLFEKSMSMSDMMIASTMGGGNYGGDWWVNHVKDTEKEMRIDLDGAMWNNENHQFLSATLYGATSQVITKMEGIIYQIRHNGGFTQSYGPGSLTMPVLNAFLAKAKRGSKKKTLFAGDNLMKDIEDLIALKYYNTESVKRYGAIAGDDVINIVQIRKYGLIVDVIWNASWGDTLPNTGILLDDNYIFKCGFAPDKKGSREWRFEQAVTPDGKPYETALYLAHLGVGISCAPYHGILEP